VTLPDTEIEADEAFAPARPRLWPTAALLGIATFAIAALSIRSAAERQAPILDSMEIQPFASAAAFAYAWGSKSDAEALEGQVLALAERGREGPQTKASTSTNGEPNFDALRRMDADMAKFRLAVLRGAPERTFAELCAAATIRCTPYTLAGLVNMLQKERLVHDAP
jgi:hypothetical protein